MRPLATRSKQAGMSLIEAVAALAVVAGVVQLAASMSDDMMRDTRAIAAAQHMRAVGEAARNWIRANSAAVAAGSSPTSPFTLPVTTLVADGFLSPGFQATNAYRQTLCVQILQPAANQLEGIVVALDGEAVDDGELGMIATNIGAAGGAVYSANTGTVQGVGNGWAIAPTNYASKDCTGADAAMTLTGRPVMALWMGDNDAATAFIYRDAIPGRADLNTMNTTLNLGGNRIVNAFGTTANTICAGGVNTGDLARDTNTGRVLSCMGGIWREQQHNWGDPVADKALLDAIPCDADSDQQVRAVGPFMANPQYRLFSCVNGTGWVAATVDELGALGVPGNLIVNGTATMTGNATIDGQLDVSTTPPGAPGVRTVMRIGQTQTDVVEVRGVIDAQGSIVPPVADFSSPCNPIGSLARDDTTGDLLICRP